MKIYTILFALLLFVLIPVNALAIDYANLDFIGVSQNGKYMAFEEYGEQDGSGDFYSSVYLIDVVQNKYAASPVKIKVEADKGNVETARAKAKKVVAANLKKFGIIKNNTGKLVVARLLTDAEFAFDPYKDSFKTQTINFQTRIGLLYNGGEYKLTLEPLKVESKKDYFENPVYKLDLSLTDNIKKTTKTLQKDKTLPESRGLPLGYRIERVYLYGDKIIVFLNKFSTGFEGPDMFYMAVTGTLGK